MCMRSKAIADALMRILARLIGKESVLVMAMFFAQRVILGKTAFADVPAVLKPQVRELLVDAGLGELAEA